MSSLSSVRVREVSDLVTKGTTPTTIGRRYTSSGVRFLKVETFDAAGNYLPGFEAFIDDTTHQLLRRSRLAAGDILFSIAGALGRSTIVESSWLPANTNQALAIIRPSKRRRVIDPRYLLWQLRSPTIAKHIAEINVQAAQANLSLEQVRNFEIPLVSLSEQQAIATALDDADAVAKLLERLIAKNQAIRQGMTQQLVTGQTRLPGFDEAWTDSTVGSLARVTGGGTPSTRLPAYWGGGIPWFTPAEIDAEGAGLVSHSKRTITADGLANSSATLLPAGSVLVTSRASIGNCAVAKVAVTTNQGFASMIPRDHRSTWFLYYWTQQNKSELQSRAAGSTFLEIGASKVAAIPLQQPSLDEQQAIGATLRDADLELDVLRRRLEKAKAIKQGMAQQLLSGKTRLPVLEAAV